MERSSYPQCSSAGQLKQNIPELFVTVLCFLYFHLLTLPKLSLPFKDEASRLHYKSFPANCV